MKYPLYGALIGWFGMMSPVLLFCYFVPAPLWVCFTIGFVSAQVGLIAGAVVGEGLRQRDRRG